MKKMLFFLIPTVIIMWHLLLCASARTKECFDEQNCRSFLTYSINPLTDHVTATIHEPWPVNDDVSTPLPSSFKFGFETGFSLVVERKCNSAAHEYFDLYAMVFPYTVSLEGL